MSESNDGITRYVDLLNRRTKVVIALLILVMAASVAGIFQLQIRTEFDVFMPSQSNLLDLTVRTANSFGDSEQLLVLPDPEGPAIDAATIGDQLSAIAGVSSVVAPAAESSMIQAEMSENMFRLLLQSDADFGDVIADIRSVFANAGAKPIISGEPYLEAEIFRYILRIIITIPPAAIILMLLVFRLRIGSMKATIFSMVPAIIGAIVTLGSVGWTRGGVSMVTVLVPIFVIVLGSADGLHITSHVIDALSAGSDKRTAVIKTLRAVGVPVVLTTLTTMAGFLSMLVVNSPAIRELGIAAAAGVAIAGLATWLILPTILLHQAPTGRREARSDGRDRIAEALLRLRGWPSIVFAVVLVAVFVPGALRIQANLSMINVYKPRTEVRQNIEKMTDTLGGSIPVYVVFNAGSDLDPDVARAVLELETEAQNAGLAGRTLSAYSIIRTVWETASGNSGYPPSVAVAKTLLTRIARTNPEIVNSFFASDGTGRAAFFLKDLDNGTLTDFQDLVHRISQETGIEMTAVGTAFVMKDMNDQITPQLLMSLALAAGLVFLLTAFTQRNILLGLAATIPIIITLVTLFGVMGYARIDLSVITGIMSGLTVGVGIDYAIHYVSLLQQARRRGDERPADTALGYVATPVLANALGLAIGFTAMLFSPLQIHVTLSILMWVTMVTSAVLSLTFLPTITGRRRR